MIAQTALAIGDDVKGLIDLIRPVQALYIGGMGARGQNFYNNMAVRYGYEQGGRRDPGRLPGRAQGRGGRR